MKPLNSALKLLPAVTALALLAVLPAFAIDLLVYNNNNSGPGSLRQAINDSNALGGGNIIIISNSVAGTITLTSGALIISTNATIVGPGPHLLTISGNNASRVFNISGGTVAISGLTIANGRPGGNEYGGGMINFANLSVSNCLLTSNTAHYGGGAIYSPGNLMVEHCAFVGNTASSLEGGALNIDGGTAVVKNTTIVSNACGLDGGGISKSGGGSLTVLQCTIVANRSLSPSAIDEYVGGVSGSFSVGGSIIAGNFSASTVKDVGGIFVSLGYNLIGQTNGSAGWGAVGDQLGTSGNPINPMLLPLGMHGGLTPTMPPAPGSPTIDQCKNSGGFTDQRGRLRTYDNLSIFNATLGDGTDIGAAELGAGINLLVTNSNDSGPGSLRQAVFDASSMEDDTVTFAPNVTNTITLTSGEIAISKRTFIVGPTARALTVSGNNSSRVFHVSGGSSFVQSLTIANGLAGLGGGILMDFGNLELNSCQVVSNAVGFFGSGGGIYVRSNAVLTVNDCSITHNLASYGGGGIGQVENAFVVIHSSTIASNRTTYVFDGIFGGYGGGIGMNGGVLHIYNSTIASNVSAYTSGGIANGYFVAGTANVQSSIIAGNTAASSGPDITGVYNSGGYNLIGNSSGFNSGFTNSTDQLNVNPLLGPLGPYGGRTLSLALRSGSPALDKGRNFFSVTDQRGVVRPLEDSSIPNAAGGDGTDIGAHEADPRFRIVNFSRVGNDVGLSFMTMLGKNYRAEYTNNLASGNWTTFTNNALGNGWLLWVTNFGGANQAQRFYRGTIVP